MFALTRRAAMAGLAGAFAISPPVALAQSGAPTAREVFRRIREASGQPWDPNPTDDRIIYGDRDAPVTGIATCFFGSLDVLRQARESGLNYIIPHEASFYERYDDFAESVIPDDDPVLLAKKRFMDENRMVIQRMHSHAHSRPGDAIMIGLIERLGWPQYRPAEGPPILQLPATSALELGRHIKARLGLQTLRMFGDPAQRVSTVAVSAGMPGENSQIALMETPGVEAVLLGEVREPEVLGYAQDLATTRPVVVYLAGHTGEDFGMRNLAEWLATGFPGLPTRWIPTPDPYTNPA
jgi:putative NIF3 family GTP cyclohydrolase 1 type 2